MKNEFDLAMKKLEEPRDRKINIICRLIVYKNAIARCLYRNNRYPLLIPQSKQPPRMDLTYPSNRLSTSSEEQSIFYIDDPVPLQDCLLSPERPSEGSLIPRDEHSSFDVGTLAELHPSPRPRSYHQRRRNSSVSSQCSGSTAGAQGRPRRHRRPSEYIEGSGRRASTCHGGPGRPRSGSYARVTPLGRLPASAKYVLSIYVSYAHLDK